MITGVILCPKCHAKSNVIDSRETAVTVRRRRECPECKDRWSTWEVKFDDGMEVDALKEAALAALLEAKSTMRDALAHISEIEERVRTKRKAI